MSERRTNEAGGVVVRMPDRRGGRGLDVLEGVDEHELAEELDGVQIDAVLDALRGLREQIRAQSDRRAARLESDDIDWMALVDELRRRLSTLGMVERSADVDDFGMDPFALERMNGLLDFLCDSYWRIEVAGDESIPAQSPLLLVANRSGLLPYDGLMLAHVLERIRPSEARARFLVADWLVTLPFVQPALARVGGVRACRENAGRLLRTGRSVIAFPEGAKGATKVFGDRYRLQRFGRGGVVRAAIAADVPLVPVGIVGAEEAHPILFKSHRLGRPIGLPFVPVTPTFPLLGPAGLLPLPAKWIVNFGEPIDVGSPRGAADEDLRVSRLTEELRSRVQALVDEALDLREAVFS